MTLRTAGYSFAILVAAVLLLTGCDLTDLNDDPNSPTEVTNSLQLTGLLAHFSYEVVGNEPARTPSLWVQQAAFNGTPLSPDNYDHKSSDVNNLWEFNSYPLALANARDLATRSADQGHFAYTAIGKTIEAFNLMIVTDLWGDVPYSEAFDPSNTQPAYDAQEDVYASIIALLESALEDYDRPSPQTPGSDDLLYGGDLVKWERLTATLLARANLRLTEAPGNDASARAQAALTAVRSGFQSNADDADFAYFDASNSQNPWYQFTIDSKWIVSHQLSKHYVDLLKTRRDPRLAVQARQAGAVTNTGVDPSFTPAPFNESMYALDDPTYTGHVNGEQGTTIAGISSIGSLYSAPDAPLTWVNYAEAKFIEAEALFRTQGPDAADPVYRDAIRASMNKLGVAAGDRDAYVDSRPALAAANGLDEILTEKYVANFLNLEAYNDWRRTGVPRLTPVTTRPQTPNGIIPLRYPYPESELASNATSVEATGVPLGFPALEVPVWWDTTP